MRVCSWLRMNAGGGPNTCKSNGIYMKPSDCKFSGGRVSNAWVTCLVLGDNSLPLVLLIRFAFHRNIYIATISVLSAYLMCTPRKWFGTLAAFFFDGSPVVANLVSICVTIPLLYLVIRYIAPYIIRLHYENKKTLLLFFLLPLSYYILEYTLTVYTDLLYTGGPVIIDFMDSFLVLFFFILAMVSLDFSNKKSTAERENLLLTTAAAQA